MPYARSDALKYARTFWNTVASDGYVCKKSAPYYEKIALGTLFEQSIDDSGQVLEETIKRGNSTSITWAELEDCSHFISCCLGSPPGGKGGGLAITSDFPAGPYGKLNAQGLFDYLVAKQWVQIVAEKKNHADAKALLSSIAAGDLIFYFDPGANTYGHSALFLAGADNDIACHTYCRCDVHNDYKQAWDSVGLRTYTFAKVK